VKTLQISNASIEQLPDVAKRILQFANQVIQGANCVFAFYGEMGAGKTTLIKEMCRQLGSSDNFSSPTYSIVNEYQIGENESKIYHIDLYRLKNIDEALAIGIEEYINGESYCFIEWPQLIEQLLPVNTVKVEIKFEDNTREISIFMI